MHQHPVAGEAPESLETILTHLHDAFVELEVWRQHARGGEEREALHRLTGLLARASQEIRRSVAAVSDPTQETLPLEEGRAAG